MKSAILTIILLLLCSGSVLFAQFENGWECGLEETELEKSVSLSKINFIDPLPTYDGINFKVAVLYFKDADDTFNGGGDCRVNSWPITSDGPNWMGELLIATRFNAATVDTDTAAHPYSITTYFYQMSGGNIWIYGDEYAYPNRAPNTVLNTPTTAAVWRAHNEIIHQWFIDNHNLTDLDNDSDGDVDMVIFLNRAGYAPWYQGIASGAYLPSPVDITGAPGEPDILGRTTPFWSNSGVFARNIYDLLDTYVVLHEIGHQLRRAGHINGLHRWNLMSGGAGANSPTHSGLVLSAWERIELGWQGAAIDTITTDELDYHLADVTSSSEAVLIPVGTNYFLLESRRNRERFEIRENCGVSTNGSLAEGLLVSYSINNNAPTIRPADGAVAVIGGTNRDGDATDLFPNGGITEITPYTTPNTNDHLGNVTHIAITNIHYDGNDIVCNIYQNYWSGTIPSSMTWTAANSPYTIGGDITVPTGMTLTIQSGVTVNFLRNQDDESGGIDANKIELIVEGTLVADGVTFTCPAQTANAWYGIVFDNASPSWASTIENSTIEWAYRGIRVINSFVTLENNVLYANQYGIWSTSSSLPYIIHNEIERSAYGVVVSSDGFAYLENNKINALHSCIYLASGGRVMGAVNNDLLGYTNYGTYGDRQIYTTGSGSGGSFGASWGGNFFSKDVRLGVCYFDGGFPFDFHYNNFEGVGVGSYYMYNNTGYQIDAENNYWDNGGTPSSSLFTGSVDYTPVLSTPPTAGATWKTSVSPFATGFDYFKNRDFQNAALALRQALDNNIEHPEAAKALSLYARALRELKERTRHVNYFNNIFDSFRDDQKGQVARSYLLNYYADAKDLTRAESIAMSAPAGSLADRELLLDMVYRYALNEDEDGEKRIVEILQKRYSDDENLAFSLVAAKEFVPDELAYKRYKEMADVGTKPDITVNTGYEPKIAFSAYPNPFNPVTKLNYSLNEDQRVSIKIYNLLGEEVKTLYNGMQTKGAYEITWNAKNNTGSSVASGVYLVQMVTNQIMVAKKILYLK